MELPIAENIDDSKLLGKAFYNAGKWLGFTQKELANLISSSVSTLNRGGIELDSLQGQYAIRLIRIYRSLYVLLGGEKDNMQHWMHSHNTYLGSIPAQMIKSLDGLVNIVEYLDAMRGKN